METHLGIRDPSEILGWDMTQSDFWPSHGVKGTENEVGKRIKAERTGDTCHRHNEVQKWKVTMGGKRLGWNQGGNYHNLMAVWAWDSRSWRGPA